MCIGGRDLTEPKLDPAGTDRRFRRRGRSGGAADPRSCRRPAGPSGILTTLPAPAPGRGLGGGCFDWLPDGSGVVYAGDRRRAVAPARARAARAGRLTTGRRRPSGPGAGRGPGRLVRRLRGRPGRGLAAAARRRRRAAASTTGSTTSASTPPSIPTGRHRGLPGVERAGHAVGRRASIVTVDARRRHAVDVAPAGRGRPAAAVRARRHPGRASTTAPAGSQVWWGDRPLVAGGDEVEHAGPSWGLGPAVVRRRRRTAGGSPSPATSGGSAGCASPTSATGAVTEIARGVHGQLSWRGDRLAALRTGARTPTQVVVYDTADVGTPRRRRRTGRRLGRRRPGRARAASRSTTTGRCCTPAGTARPARPAACCAGCTAARPTSGRSRSCPGSRTGSARGGTCCVPDHRGSTGHGRAYQQALHGRWGELDVADTDRLARPRRSGRLGAAGAHRAHRRVGRRLHRAPRPARPRPRPGRRRGRAVPGDGPRRAGGPQPPLRGPLHRHAWSAPTSDHAARHARCGPRRRIGAPAARAARHGRPGRAGREHHRLRRAACGRPAATSSCTCSRARATASASPSTSSPSSA